MIGDKVVLYGKVTREGDLRHRRFWFEAKATNIFTGLERATPLLEGLGLVGFQRYDLVEITIKGIKGETVLGPEVARVKELELVPA